MAEREKAKPKASPAKKKPESKAKPPSKASKAEAHDEGMAATKTKTKSKSTSSPDIYTDPKLRDRLKEEITAGDKGGKPGQWSARKAQLLASEYEKAGGDYKNGKKKKTEAQSHLDSWTKEDWKTSDGEPAEREGGTTRYLPEKAWEQLTPAEKKATNAKKQEGSKEGDQYVANTDEAKTARKAATKTATKSKPKSASKSEPKAKPKSAAPKARKKSS